MPSQRFECRVRFTCPECRNKVSTTVDAGAELGRRKGFRFGQRETDVQCPVCKALFDGFCIASATSCEVTLEDHPDTVVEAELPSI